MPDFDERAEMAATEIGNLNELSPFVGGDEALGNQQDQVLVGKSWIRLRGPSLRKTPDLVLRAVKQFDAYFLGDAVLRVVAQDVDWVRHQVLARHAI